MTARTRTTEAGLGAANTPSAATPRALALAALAALAGCTEPAPTSEPSAEVAVVALPAPAEHPRAPAPASHTPVDGRAFPDKVIALTWDDGPDASTLELARYLERRRISATFFVVGAWVEGLSDDPGDGKGVFASGYEFLPILGDLVRLRHRVGNHTLNHVVLRESRGAETVLRELRVNQENLDPFLTNELRLFRAPGGGWGSFAKGIVDADPYLGTMVGPIAWDVDRKDWDESLHCRGPRGAFECERGGPGGALRMKAQVVAARYVAAVESAGHGIVLLHDRVGHVGSSYGLDVAKAMIPQLEARGYVFAAPVLQFSPPVVRHRDPGAAVEGAHRWDPASLRVGDVNGDGREDVCGRDAAGVTCAISVHDASTSAVAAGGGRLPRTTFLAVRADKGGVASGASGEVPRGALDLADVTGDGQADLCIAGAAGIACAASIGAGAVDAFRSWSSDDSAALLGFADVDGDGRADACSRTAAGIACARSVGKRFDAAHTWLADLSDARGWAAPKYASTVQLADVDGDGRADVCGRSQRGVVCALSTGHGFARLEPWSAGTDFADEAGWDRSPAFFGSLRFGDLNGDGRDDVCGRGPMGIVCALSTGRAFARATVWLSAELAEAEGWLRAEPATPLQLGDINGDGRADLCGASPAGLACALAP